MIHCVLFVIDLKISIADILTLIVVILTLLTLIQVKRQRESMYMPDIFIGERSASFKGFDLNEEFSHFTYSFLRKSKENDKNDEEFYPWLELYIHNVGFGAAKYVKGKWEYDFNAFVNLIKKVVDNKTFELRTSKQDGINEFNLEHISSNHFNSGSEYLALSFEQNLVLPKNTIDESPKIFIPQIYIDLLTYYLAFKHEMFNSNSKESFIFDELNEIPRLKLTLNYRDIGNKNHTKSMYFIFSVSDESGNESKIGKFGNKKLGTYHIDIKEER